MAAGYIIRAMPMLEGKTGLIFGVANKRSIAWAIAQALAREGMRLAFTYQGERLKEGVEALATTIPGSVILPCDVTSDAEIDAVMARCGEAFGRLDCLVHSVAFAPREDLENEYVRTSRDGFKAAHDISAYSLVALCRAALPLFEKAGGGAVLAMTYYGAVKVVDSNVVGVLLKRMLPPPPSPSVALSLLAGKFSTTSVAEPLLLIGSSPV